LLTFYFVLFLLQEYLLEDKHFFGICLGMQTLFESSEECPGVAGLGLIKGGVAEFDAKATGLSVPHIGWSTIDIHKSSRLFNAETWSGPKAHERRLYFVHSFFAPRITSANEEWVLTTSKYGNEFVSAVQKGNVMATQFHPEKSGDLGIDILRGFLERTDSEGAPSNIGSAPTVTQHALSKRIIACLDVRSNDAGDLVVTKGESYDVREAAEEPEEPVDKKLKTSEGESENGGGDGYTNTGKVRNLGKPVDLCARYYEEGADEVTFLNITSFRSEPLEDAPMLKVLEHASARVFVPLTIGGGIRNYTDKAGEFSLFALFVCLI
jgi:glutamine amidotransferase/cyclase